MKYLNKRTGSVIIVPCRLEGPDWQEITEAKPEPAKETPVKAAPKRKTVKKG